MTAGLCNKLGLRIIKVNVSVVGVNQSKTKILETIRATIRSMYNDFKEKLMFMVVHKITTNLSSEPLDFKKANISANVLLVDPEFYKPKKVDILFGVDLFWELICYEPIKYPHLCKTKLGYVVSGRLLQRYNDNSLLCNLSTSTNDIMSHLERFWKIKALPSKRLLSSEEQACELQFV